MPRNGSGVYSLPSGNPVVDDTPIEASWANTTLSDIATEITGSLPRNGAAPMTGALGMGNYKILNLADGTAATDAATKGQTDSALAAHVAAADPHPGYLTEVAAAAAYQPLDAELSAIAELTSAANKVPMFSGSETATLLDFKDEDNMASNSATAVPSQQSVKAYVDALGTIASGTYTPTITAGTNTSNITIPSAWVYMRIGTVVHVAGHISIDPVAANTSTAFYLSVPVVAFFADSFDCSGVINGENIPLNGAGRIQADGVNERMIVNMMSGSTTNPGTYCVIASYVI